MAPAGCRTHRHASRERLQNMIISYITYITSYLAIPHHMPCKNKLDVLYFVLANFTWLLRATYKNHSYLRKATTVIYKLPFNLLQDRRCQIRFNYSGRDRHPPAALCNTSYMSSAEPVSCAWTSKVGPGRFIPLYRQIQKNKGG